ncbi:hypothetical protein V6U77_05440 [Micromonospora sp. CPCC 205546]|uniref:hypothetical protein n=1 Tax=Micromonospora sp. CPCC 205546 TaxID=3122397 RepID=UPI002FEF8DBE
MEWRIATAAERLARALSVGARGALAETQEEQPPNEALVEGRGGTDQPAGAGGAVRPSHMRISSPHPVILTARDRADPRS